MSTQQGLRQQSVRDLTGTAYPYVGDWMALFDLADIPAGPYEGRLLAWLNLRMTSSFTVLSGAMQAFAEHQGAYNWASLGTFDVPIPFAFGWTPPILPKRTETGWEGHIPTSDLIPDVGDGVEYWVDPVSGSDAANGLTAVTPFKGIDTALAKTDAGIVNVAAQTAGGIIWRDDRWAASPASTKPGLIVRRWDLRAGAVNLSTGWNHNGAGWSQHGTHANVYTITRSTVGRVLDMAQEGVEAGAWLNYALVADAAACQAAEGSYYIDGTTLGVHQVGGGSPGTNVLVLLAETLGFGQAACPPLYVEGINFVGGNRPFFISNTLETTGYRHVFKDCGFLYGIDPTNGNGFHITGSPEVILDNCIAAYNRRDGFNYAIRTQVIPKVVEINCIGKWNGDQAVSSGNNNGSTMHSAGTIVRIGGEYFENDGPNVADVEASKRWNVGVYAHDSRRATPSTQAADFYNSAGLSWLFECEAAGSDYAVTTTSGGTTYLDSFTDDGGDHESTGATETTYKQLGL